MFEIVWLGMLIFIALGMATNMICKRLDRIADALGSQQSGAPHE